MFTAHTRHVDSKEISKCMPNGMKMIFKKREDALKTVFFGEC